MFFARALAVWWRGRASKGDMARLGSIMASALRVSGKVVVPLAEEGEAGYP
jgi:hypothetical protein